MAIKIDEYGDKRTNLIMQTISYCVVQLHHRGSGPEAPDTGRAGQYRVDFVMAKEFIDNKIR